MRIHTNTEDLFGGQAIPGEQMRVPHKLIRNNLILKKHQNQLMINHYQIYKCVLLTESH